MANNVFVAEEIKPLLDRYVRAELYTDRKDDAHIKIDGENRRLQQERFGDDVLPLYVLLTTDGREIARLRGQASVADFRVFLLKGLSE